MPSEGSDGIGIGESEAVAHAQRGFVGFEAGVFQASPVVVAVAGVQGQLGRDVETDAGDDTEATRRMLSLSRWAFCVFSSV